MEIIQRLFNEWMNRACGLTIDIVGDAELSSELQWVLAVPVNSGEAEQQFSTIEDLRRELTLSGLHVVQKNYVDQSTQLPNGIAVEPMCPYRPESCIGDHLVATGHGLVSEQHFTPKNSD